MDRIRIPHGEPLAIALAVDRTHERRIRAATHRAMLICAASGWIVSAVLMVWR